MQPNDQMNIYKNWKYSPLSSGKLGTTSININIEKRNQENQTSCHKDEIIITENYWNYQKCIIRKLFRYVLSFEPWGIL